MRSFLLPVLCGSCWLHLLKNYYSKVLFFSKGFPDSSVGKESTCNTGDPSSIPWVGKIHCKRDRLPTPVFLGFSCSSAGKESACNVGNLGSIPGLGRSPGEEKGYPLQHSGLENPMDSIVHVITKSQAWLSDFHFNDILRVYIKGLISDHILICILSFLLPSSLSPFLL